MGQDKGPATNHYQQASFQKSETGPPQVSDARRAPSPAFHRVYTLRPRAVFGWTPGKRTKEGHPKTGKEKVNTFSSTQDITYNWVKPLIREGDISTAGHVQVCGCGRWARGKWTVNRRTKEATLSQVWLLAGLLATKAVWVPGSTHNLSRNPSSRGDAGSK